MVRKGFRSSTAFRGLNDLAQVYYPACGALVLLALGPKCSGEGRGVHAHMGVSFVGGPPETVVFLLVSLAIQPKRVRSKEDRPTCGQTPRSVQWVTDMVELVAPRPPLAVLKRQQLVSFVLLCRPT